MYSNCLTDFHNFSSTTNINFTSEIKSNNITVGIDLGTDKCCITYQDSIGRPFVITDESNFKISSIIGILNNGLLIGNEISKDFIYDIPIITNLKRLIGHKADSIEALNIAKYNNWVLEMSSESNLIIKINNISYELNYLMCMLLKKLKQIIINSIGENFDCVITVPANFNEGQKNQILEYCKQTNIKCKRLVYEPCSAALAYINYFDPDYNLYDSNNKIIKQKSIINDVNKMNAKDLIESTDSIDSTNLSNSDDVILKRIMVFDFGAGTLDLAIVSCNCLIENEQIEWMAKIESNTGDNNLGGLDIDIALGTYLKNTYPKFAKLLESKNESIKFIIEKIKIKLSNLYMNGKSQSQSLIERYYEQIIVININEYFELLNAHFKHRIIKLLDTLHNDKISKSEIDTILLIGGSCYNPWVNELITEYYKKSIKSYKLNLTDHITTFNLDIKDIGVSLGATCIDKKSNCNQSSLILTESLPLSIGIDTTNNLMCKLIPKNTLIPSTAKKYFTTSEDFQTMIEIKLYQGERDDVRNNFFLGSFCMDNLESLPQGQIVIIVNISVTTDGLIIVEGKVRNTDKYNKKIIINRYDTCPDYKQIEYNVNTFETNDVIFSSIMCKYYELITMLSRLQYNLLDNIACKLESEIISYTINLIWHDLLIVHNLCKQSEKICPNIAQLDKFIQYVEKKLNMTTNNVTIDWTDDSIIILKLNNLIKFIQKHLNHLVSTHQIKTETANSASQIESKYDTLDSNVKLNQLQSISNPTEILSKSERNLLYDIEHKISSITGQTIVKSDLVYIAEIKDLSIMIVNEIDKFETSDVNKLLLLEILDKFESYIDLIVSLKLKFNALTQLEYIQNICMNVVEFNDSCLVESFQQELLNIDIIDESSILKFELFMQKILNFEVDNSSNIFIKSSD